MCKRILVPLDGSDAGEIVRPYCEEIAARLSSEIVLVRVSESGTDLDVCYSYLERIAEQVKSRLKEYAAQGETKVRYHVLRGSAAVEILRYARECDADLIAMASLGTSGRGPWLLGAIAAKVLRAATTPILLIRSKASDAAMRERRLLGKILLPLDGSRVGEAAIPHAEVLARALGAELVLFRVMEPVTAVVGEGYVAFPSPQEEESQKLRAMSYLEGVEKLLKEKGLKTSRSAMVSGSPADQIIEYAEANAIDLIAISTHGRSGIRRWVFGSVTDKVLHAGNTAIFLVQSSRTQPSRVSPEQPIEAVVSRENNVAMKAYFLFTAGGPLVILTSYDSIENPKLLKRLTAKGITKFIAHEVPVELAKERYGMHFDIVSEDVHETDDLRILDYSGERAFRNFRFSELGAPVYYES